MARHVVARRSKSARRALRLNTAPSNEVLTTSETKTHLRVDHSDDDTLIDALVKAARSSAEDWLNRSFLDTTWDYWLDEGALDTNIIELPRAPLSSITQIDSFDDDNNTTTFASTKYYALTGFTPGRVALVDGNDWPTDLREYGALRIRYVSGWGSQVSNIPTQYREWIKRGLLLTVAAMYENRGDERPGKAFAFELPEVAKQVLWPLKVLRGM